MRMTAARGCHRKRWRNPGLVFLSAIFVIAYYTFFQQPLGTCGRGMPPLDDGRLLRDQLLAPPASSHSVIHRRLLLHPDHNTSNSNNESAAGHHHLPEDKPQAQFPEDLFTEEQRKKGAVIFHVIGLVYMFVALAIVCDEFFVPSLDVITEKLGISEDVAGATFMAAGGSAPELFTSVIGVFISYDDVGIGTIVGSAVFNILFVISMCAIFSKTVLLLTWWPLFRDVTFYSISLMILIICFKDNTIHWYEASILLMCYFAYVTFMKFNEQVEKAVRKLLNRSKFTRVGSTDHLVPNLTKRRVSTPILHAGSKFRHGLLQLMIHSIDPLHEGKLDEKASQLHAIASLRVLLDATRANGGYPTCTTIAHAAVPASGGCCSACATCSACVACPTCARPLVTKPIPGDGSAGNLTSYTVPSEATVSTVATSDGEVPHVLDPLTNFQNFQSVSFSSLANGVVNEIPDGEQGGDRREDRVTTCDHTGTTGSNASNISTIVAGDSKNPGVTPPTSTATQQQTQGQDQSQTQQTPAQPEQPEEEPEEPLDIRWPDTNKKRVTYVLLAPLVFPLWMTLPDVRRPEKRKWFVITFLGSILWIAIFSYLMVWWASMVGSTLTIPNEVMGLTFLAAGTSIPDLITSVLVARKGFGDMAVSSSVGSNIFDVTVGLPLPWLLSSIIFGPVKVSSAGMACSIFILFLMLLFVIVSIACFKWKMNVGLALVMLVLYFAFVAVSLLLEYEIVSCANVMSYFGAN